jgi:flagellar hook-basal body complex protein FliE
MIAGSIAALPQTNVSNSVARAFANGESTETFGAMVSQTGLDAVQKLKAAEMVSRQALSGEVPVREVASAVMAAEQTLQLSMAVRDKIVSAYLELSRMQI